MITMAVKLAEGIYSVSIPLPNNPLRNLNSYFIKTPSRNMIIDTGFNLPQCKEALQAGIEELDIDLSITDFFLTHLHADHSGLVDQFATGQSKVYIGVEDADFLRFIINDKPGFYDLTKNRFKAYGVPEAVFNEAVAANPAFHNTMNHDLPFIECRDNDEITVGDLSFRCIHTPGHTPGHLCLYQPDTQYLFCGDHVLFDITPNITPWPALPDALGAYLSSLRKISAYKIERTFAAHRENRSDILLRIQELLDHHENRLNELYQIVNDRPMIDTYQAAALLKWSIRAVDWESFPATQKFFALGETDAHLIHLEQIGKISCYHQGGINRYSVK